MSILLKSAVILPALASGIWLAKPGPMSIKTSPAGSHVNVAVQSDPTSGSAEIENAILVRRIRIERILMTLDHVAEAAMQMHPDRAAALEPVIVDLAEQTLDLTSETAVLRGQTDTDLTEIEDTLDELVTAMDMLIEPEMSL